MAKRRKWTKEEDDFILAHYNKQDETNLTVIQISDILKIPRGTIITRYAKLKGRRVGTKYIKKEPTVTPLSMPELHIERLNLDNEDGSRLQKDIQRQRKEAERFLFELSGTYDSRDT